jgi:ABC-2 type transport system ATP-binding protein
VSAIVAEGLRKRYGGTVALDGLDLEVPAGVVCGLLGPNGAGKTTAVQVLTTLRVADGGRAQVAGFDVARQPAQVRRNVGLVAQSAAVDEILSGRQNLTMFGRLLRLGTAGARRRADELLERFGLADAGSRPVKDYSGGMRRRLDLAASLILSPPVLFLDEPTTGLDPRGRGEVWAAVRGLVDGGTTVLLTTQYLEEADQLAHAIAVIDHGRVIAEGSPDELKARLGGDRIDVVVHDDGALAHRGGDRRRGGRRRAGARPRPAPRERARTRPDGRARRGDARAVRRPHRGGGRRAPPADARRGVPGADRGGARMTAIADGWVLTQRALMHWVRQPGQVLVAVLFTVMVMLMFAYLFGGQVVVPGGGDYIDFLVPGMLAVTMLFGVESTVLAVVTDAARGVTERFRSMPIASSAVVVGRATADMLQTLVVLAAIVAAGLAIGWGWSEGAADALAAFGLLLLLRFAFVWIGIYLGLLLRTP